MTLREIWKFITTTRTARALEAELARERAETGRLRAENRALLNSILGIAGIPPLPAPPPGDDDGARALYTASLADVRERSRPAAPPRTSAANGPNGSGAARAAAPMRRRSWQQINRLLELDSARKQNSS